MRKIKFRAWDKCEGFMIDIKHFGFDEDGSFWYLLSEGDDVPYFTEQLGHSFELMQYTGRKDKNGIEIYEGDIYRYKYYFDSKRYEYRHIIVEWGTTDIIYEGVFHGYELNDEHIEVIGNIYENEELLNER